MRRFFLLLMVVLLPLRGWAGDVMVIEAMKSHAAQGVEMAQPADCPMHAQSAEQSGHWGWDGAPAKAPPCASCDLCLPFAPLTGAGAVEVCLFKPPSVRVTQGAVFFSAVLALLFKPPIS